MEILFIILKIIGVLLAVLLLLCFALMLVPIRYRVDIEAQDEIEGKAAVHWLFHLLDVRVFYKERDISFKIRILGIAIPLDKGKKNKKTEPQEPVKKTEQTKTAGKAEPETEAEQGQTAGKAEPETEAEQAQTAGKAEPETEAEQAQTAGKAEPETEAEPAKQSGQAKEPELEREAELTEQWGQAKETELKRETEQAGTSGSQNHQPRSSANIISESRNRKKNRKKPGIFTKIKSSFHNFGKKMKEAPGKLRQRRSDVKTRTDAAKGQIGNIKSMILEETNQKAFICLLQEVRCLLRHYLPGKVTGTLRFSMGRPDQTGKALGSISLLPFWARSKLVVMPDFTSESFYMKGILYITGHVRFLHALISGIRLIKDRNVRKLIANIRS